MPEYPSGTVAFLFTDIEGSTRRWERTARRWRPRSSATSRCCEEAIAAHDGVLFKTIGDAIQAAFPTVPKAIAAAIDAQIALRREDWGELGPLRVRMAIHAGEATPRDGDYLAPALNRLLARPGDRVRASRSCSRIRRAPWPRRSPLAMRSRIWAGTACETCSRRSASSSSVDPDCRPSSRRSRVSIGSRTTCPRSRRRSSAERLSSPLCGEMLAAPDARLGHPDRTGRHRQDPARAAGRGRDARRRSPMGSGGCRWPSIADPALVPQAIAAALGVRESSRRAAPDDAERASRVPPDPARARQPRAAARRGPADSAGCSTKRRGS